MPATVPADLRYIFHHVALDPYDVATFASNGEYWRVLLAKGFHVNVRQVDIVRIEPAEDLKDFRTWIDKTGKFSTVAKFVNLDGRRLTLSVFEGGQVSLNANQLSLHDQKQLRRIVEDG